MNTRNLDFIQGQEHGTVAFANGITHPAADRNYLDILVGRHMSSPRTSNYLDGWQRGWDQENVAAPVLKVGP